MTTRRKLGVAYRAVLDRMVRFDEGLRGSLYMRKYGSPLRSATDGFQLTPRIEWPKGTTLTLSEHVRRAASYYDLIDPMGNGTRGTPNENDIDAAVQLAAVSLAIVRVLSLTERTAYPDLAADVDVLARLAKRGEVIAIIMGDDD